jgi:ABC-type sugar transport system ATPase subunit
VIIQSEGLNKSFRGHDALRGVSLAVPPASVDDAAN